MKKHIQKHKHKLVASTIGASLMHHADWTVHGVMEFISNHNALLTTIAATTILVIVDLFSKRG